MRSDRCTCGHEAADHDWGGGCIKMQWAGGWFSGRMEECPCRRYQPRAQRKETTE